MTNNLEDLFKFLTGDEDISLNASPATGLFRFFIEVNTIVDTDNFNPTVTLC